jgi:DNA-binding transcriptional MocR family regulator
VSENSPQYERIARTLSTLIERGALRPGDRLPFLRDACEQSGASFGTTMHAYARLEDFGLIEARPRSGYQVRARPSPLAAKPVMSSPPTVSTEVNVASLVFDVLEAIKQPEIVPLGSAFPSPEYFPIVKLNRAAADAARSRYAEAGVVRSRQRGWLDAQNAKGAR